MAAKFYESRITAKGQTTIPVEVRERLKIKAGDTIQFVPIDGHFEIIPRNRPATNLFGRLQGYAIENTGLEDYRQALAHHFAQAHEGRGGKDEAA